MTNPDTITQMADHILSELSFREKSIIAHMDADALDYLRYAFDRYLSDLASDDEGKGLKIMKRVWESCKERYRIRPVK